MSNLRVWVRPCPSVAIPVLAPPALFKHEREGEVWQKQMRTLLCAEKSLPNPSQTNHFQLFDKNEKLPT